MTCFDKVTSPHNSEIIRIHFNESFNCTNTKLELALTSWLSFIFFLSASRSLSPLPSLSFTSPVFLSFLSLGGGEDNRQNPAESNQPTEGEFMFYDHMVTLMSWLQCSWAFPIDFPEFSPLPRSAQKLLTFPKFRHSSGFKLKPVLTKKAIQVNAQTGTHTVIIAD